jgi:hypothetical protein
VERQVPPFDRKVAGLEGEKKKASFNLENGLVAW